MTGNVLGIRDVAGDEKFKVFYPHGAYICSEEKT